MTTNRLLSYLALFALLSAVVLTDIAVLSVFGSGHLAEAVSNPTFRSLFPDLFVAGVTGVVVGLVLNYVQKRRARLDMEYEWELARLMLLDRISVFTFSPTPRNLGEIGTVGRLAEVVARYPLAQWTRELRLPVFKDLHELERLIATTQEIGQHLDKIFTGWVMNTKAPPETAVVAGGLVLEWDDAEIVLVSSAPIADYDAKIKPLARILAGLPDVVDAVEVYRVRLARAHDLMVSLRQELRLTRIADPWS